MLWQSVESSNVPQESRFLLTRSLLAAPSSSLLSDGSLDNVAVEATQAALADDGVGSPSLGAEVAAACMTRDGKVSHPLA